MASVLANGNTASVVGAEVTLAAIVLNRTAVASVGLVNMAAGDIVGLRLYRRVIAGGTLRLLAESWYTCRQYNQAVLGSNSTAWLGMPVTSPEMGYELRLIQPRGAVRMFIWTVEQP